MRCRGFATKKLSDLGGRRLPNARDEDALGDVGAGVFFFFLMRCAVVTDRGRSFERFKSVRSGRFMMALPRSSVFPPLCLVTS